MTRIQSNYTGTITGGPPLSAADTLDADAYEKINIAVPDAANVTVEVMPAVADALQLLIIKPDKIGLANLTFKVNDAAGAALPLDHPQVFSGTAGLLAGNPIEKLLFTNASGSAVNVDITVARHAIAVGGGHRDGQQPPTPVFALDALHSGAAELAITQDKVPQPMRVDEATYKLVARRLAAGVQVYDWNTQTHAWATPEAEADLYDADTGVQQGMHFFTDVPVWADVDGSRVKRTGETVSADPPSDLGDPSRDIPWLRVPAGPGNDRGGILKDVTVVQRLLTRYGKAPAAPSPEPIAPVHVHYNALYLFWANK